MRGLRKGRVVRVLVACLFGLVSTFSYARNFEPHFFFYAATAQPRVVFTSAQAAWEYEKAWLINSGSSVHPTSDLITNVLPQSFNQFGPTYFYYNYDFDGQHSSTPTLGVQLSLECQRFSDGTINQVRSAPVSGQPNNYGNVFCEKPSTPEPDCACTPANPAPTIGNPIFPSTGLKQQTETDYTGEGSNALRFVRTYRSDRNRWTHNYQTIGIDFASIQTALATQQFAWPDGGCVPGIGASTGQPYCFRYLGNSDSNGRQLANDFLLQRGPSRAFDFGNATSLVPATADINDRISRVLNSSGTVTGWRVINPANDNTEQFDLTGRLQTITSRNGQVQTLSYSTASTPASIASQPGLLIRVTDHFNHQLNFTYDNQNRLASMTDPAGGVTTYRYDETSSIVGTGNQPVGNLTSVTYPDGKRKQYWYNEPVNTSNTNLPFALTGITDENNLRYATWHYDPSGRATSSEHANGVERHQVSYPNPNVTSSVIDPLGTVRSYQFQTLLGIVKHTGTTQPAPGSGNGTGTSSGTVSTAITYDANANVASRTDFNGNRTSYSYDLTRNLETSRIEAAGTSNARTISTQWHATYRLPIKIAEPNRITTNTYDSSGNLLTKTEQATTDTTGASAFTASSTGSARTASYTYNTLGQLLTATGPRSDIVDRTSYAYDAQGNLASVTNPLGQITTFNQYDANGRALKITDANGLVTTLSYAPRGWLLSQTISAPANATTNTPASSETTRYTYDPAGQLTRVTLPDASIITYTYDPAHRLTNIADSLGNHIDYTLDALGNRIGEQIKDASGNLARQSTRVIDALGRVQQGSGTGQ